MSNSVTDHHPTSSSFKRPQADKIITVQPLKKSEMQVRVHHLTHSHSIILTIFLLPLQPSYAQDLGTGEVTHGIYGSLLNLLGECVGFCGAFPCMPCPNPYRNVNQGNRRTSYLPQFIHSRTVNSQALSVSSLASANSTKPSTRVLSRSTFVPSHSVSSMSRSKSAQSVDKWLSRETMLMLRCVFCVT